MNYSTRLWFLLALLGLMACESSPEAADPEDVMRILHSAGTYTDTGRMPLPGHWGTLVSTRGEDAQPLGVLLIGTAEAEAGRKGISPIAAVQWASGESIRTCIIAVPADSRQRRLPVSDYMDFRLSQDAYYRLLDIWLQHELMPAGARWLGWQNEVYAAAEIARSRQRYSDINQ
jgi:inorganic pyrophosphatase